MGQCCAGRMSDDQKAGVAKPPTATDGKPPSGEPPSNPAGDDDDDGKDDGKDLGAAGVGGVAPEAGDGADSGAGARAAGAEAEEKEAAGGGSRPRKTLPGMDPEEALRAFAESVGYKGDIMDGVVTECAGGAIEEIHWVGKDLDGTLPMGDLNMSKLRALDLYDNDRLKGERERAGRLLVSG